MQLCYSSHQMEAQEKNYVKFDLFLFRIFSRKWDISKCVLHNNFFNTHWFFVSNKTILIGILTPCVIALSRVGLIILSSHKRAFAELSLAPASALVSILS